MKTTLKITGLMWLMALVSCNKDITQRNLQFGALNPDKIDTLAGTWKPVLLTSAAEFSCDAPIAVTSPDYKLQLLEIKSRQANMSDADEETLKYWSAGTVLRWNEILRELVAKYNLPPYQNADGTYPIPSAANPLAYPYFPFANPPYAARAYAYVSAAQYDAVVAAYHYKNSYRRLRPAAVDPTIKELVPVVKDFAYPSEEAVVAGAAFAMMSMLFPGEQDYLQDKLNECTDMRILAGANVRSEIDAGIRLGKAVASKFIGRARNDRAGKAVGTPADWAKLESDAIARGETPWISLESPKRPPMLPLFGKTIGFLLDSSQVVANRPPAPPSTNSPEFAKEVEEVLSYSKNITRDQIRIVHFWADGAGTYTPPGHWNAIACEDFVNMRYSEARWARNLALLNMAMFDAAICCWDAKYFYFNPRPSQINAKIKTMTGVPNFPAYTSGHSTFSGAAATLLAHVNPGRAGDYMAMADEASKSRLYGAIHYRSDIEVGMQMGKKIGIKAVDRAKIDGAD
ncbi:MAG: phosphatase PAP2 family protein [Sphingomonadales bacterium]|jgi:membrane-associated phospholipid phosphatase